MNRLRFTFIAVFGVACGLPVCAQSPAYEWYFHNVRMPGADFFEAAYGNPETDERLMRFTCQSGVISVQGPLPNASLKHDDMEGTRIRVGFLASDGKRHVIDAKIAEAGDGTNYVGRITADHPLFAALVAGRAVRVQRVDFRQIMEVPARGAAHPIRSFVEACATQTSKDRPKP